MNAPTTYSDTEVADYSVRLMSGESLDILPQDLRPYFEAAQARARAIVDAQPRQPPAPQMLALTPRVCDLIRSLLKSAGCRPGEWTRWLAEIKAAECAELEAPRAPRPVFLRVVK